MRKLAVIAPILSVVWHGCQAPNSEGTEAGRESGDPSILNLSTEYYGNGYLMEDSVERLRDAQGMIQATAAYELAIPIAGYVGTVSRRCASGRLGQCPRFPVARAECHRAEAKLADFQTCLTEANRFQKKSPYLGTTLAKTFSVSRPLLGSADNFFGAAIAALCGTPPE